MRSDHDQGTARQHAADTSLIDAPALETELKTHISGEVRFDPASRGLYSTDASNYRQVPIGVVIPKSEDDVIETVRICHERGVPVLARGGGTSLAGQCCNVAVVLDFSKYMHQILEINFDERYAWVQPGLVLDDLRDRAEQHKLTFGPDPATHDHCTLGGMMGNNSCGIHALMAGKTVDNVEELDVLLYDGTRLTVSATSDAELEAIIAAGGRRGDIYRRLKALRDQYADLIRQRYPDIPRRVSGYNLDQLLPENGFNVARALIGSEGTLVTILKAKVKLVDSPPSRTLVVLGYDDVYSAGDHVPEILKYAPIGLEGVDDQLIQYMEKKGLNVTDLKLLPDGNGWLLVEFGGENRAGVRRERPKDDRRAQAGRECAVDQALRRPRRRAHGLGNPRVGVGGDGAHPRHEHDASRLGRCRHPAGASRAVSARLPRSAPALRLRLRALWAFRAGLYPRAD